MGFLQIAIRIIAIFKIAIIVRILSPSDLGIFGMTMLVIGLFETFTELGIPTFLIQLKRDIAEYLDSAWLIQVSRGLLLTIIIAIFAIPASLFFKEPKLTILIAVGAISSLIKALENPSIAAFQKELQFSREFVYRLFIVIVDLIVSVVFALITRSVFSLIYGLLFSGLAGAIFSWVAVAKRPQIHFYKKQIMEILLFVRGITLLGVFTYLVNQIDYLVIGRIAGSTSLGLYQVARKFSSTPMIEISDVFGKVTFPVYSKISLDRWRLKDAYLRTVAILAVIEFFVMVIFLSFSKEITLILAGPKWSQVGEPLRILAIYGFVASVWGSIGALFFSVGKQNILTKLAFIRLILIVPLMIWGVNIYGMVGAAYASLISLLLLQPLSLFYIILFFRKKEKIDSTI